MARSSRSRLELFSDRKKKLAWSALGQRTEKGFEKINELGTGNGGVVYCMRHISTMMSVEWVVTIILYHHPSLLDWVWCWLEEAAETKPGAAVSFLTIVTGHLVTRDTGDISMGELKEVAAWAMA